MYSTVPVFHGISLTLILFTHPIFIAADPTRQDLMKDLFYSGGFREWEVDYESRLVLCLTVLVTDSLLCEPDDSSLHLDSPSAM